MNCPKCGEKDAYVGFTKIECINGDCEHYDEDHAYRVMFKSEKICDNVPETDYRPENETLIDDYDGNALGPSSKHQGYIYDDYDGFSDFG